jgi:protocatechuate 3,4-dioxygenase beta subunit
VEAPELWVADSLTNRILILSDGEIVEDVDFALRRGGVITGKVTTSGNRPLIAKQVSLRSDKLGAQRAVSQDVFETDDRGIYRIFGLQPGKYRVSVSQQNTSLVRRMFRFNETFYPTTTDPTKAVFVEVTEGSEVTGIDITVELSEDSRSRFSVSGRVVDESNNQQPVPNIRLRLQRIEEHVDNYLNVTAVSDAKGQFRFEDLTPGKYAVITYSPSDSNLRADNTNFVVVDKDVTDVLVKAVRKASVSGIVVLEAGQNKTTLSQFGPLFLNGYVVKEGSGAFGESARIATDGSFYMKGLLSGIANFSLGAIYGGPPKGLSIARVERDGIVQTHGLEIKDQESITGVRIVLKYANGMIRGVVKLANGELPANAQVMVWLRSSQDQAVGSQTMPAVVDARGHFFIEGIPDGTHEIEASVMIPESQVRRAVTKQQVSVSAGSVTEVTLTVELTPNP